MRKQGNILKELESIIGSERVKKAEIEAKNDIFNIKLSKLREEMGIKQSQMKNYTQPCISKIEKRKDLKVSTLIDYIDNIGMKLEIKVKPKWKKKNVKDEYLLLET